MVIYKIVSVLHQTPLISAYLTPYTMDHLKNLEDALNHFPGRYLIVMGNLNADASQLQNTRNQQATNFLASFGLVDLLGYFMQRLRFRHQQT